MKAPILTRLASRELIVVTGKGGVGKSAVSAALGGLLASTGRQTLILEIDPRENVHQMLAAPPSGGEIVRVASNLYLQHLHSRTVLDQLVRERVRVEFLTQRVLDSPVYHHFSEGAPGLKEMAVLGHALLLVQGRVPGAPPIDVVIVDAPATGHGVALLRAPRLVSEVIRQGPVASMTKEVAELVASPQRCAVVVVTLAEEMPVTEALELRADLQSTVQREPDLLVANGLYPPVPASGVEPTAAAGARRLWYRRRELNDAELERLNKHWSGPRVEVPFFPLDRGPELVSEIERELRQ
ncbi:MAG: ArsA family ATPase [Thermoanaerobaculia bacterium]